mmetsp:Transcript_14736/g.41866  ORF Transcript_14736/g.41866 Transcript_14736/m.41866 type:complete len:200 (-) Transcript_14736:1008-1607(-)
MAVLPPLPLVCESFSRSTKRTATAEPRREPWFSRFPKARAAWHAARSMGSSRANRQACDAVFAASTQASSSAGASPHVAAPCKQALNRANPKPCAATTKAVALLNFASGVFEAASATLRHVSASGMFSTKRRRTSGGAHRSTSSLPRPVATNALTNPGASAHRFLQSFNPRTMESEDDSSSVGGQGFTSLRFASVISRF